jgi:hypothetical protein
MSDSAEGNVPRPGASTGANTSAPAAIEPDAAEQFASAFVPAWEFDDAPFAAGAELSTEEIQELGAGPNSEPVDVQAESTRVDEPPVADLEVEAPVSARQGMAVSTDPFPPPKRHDPLPMEPSVVIADELIQEAAMLPEPHAVVLAPLQNLDGEVHHARSSKRLLVGIGAAVVVTLGAIGGFLVLRSDAPPAAASPAATAPSTRATEDIPLPPPPAPAPPPPEVTATPAASPSAVAHVAPPTPTARETPPAPPPAPRPAANAPATHTQEAVRPPRNPPKSSTKPASGGIVRDNPF